ncbi:MAG: hypothetical protein R2939_02420 [Kofleriaceae bacterium]
MSSSSWSSLVLGVVGCGGATTPAAVGHQAGPSSPSLVVEPSQVRGALAYAPAPVDGERDDLMPTSADPTIVEDTATTSLRGPVLALPSRGAAVEVTAGAPRTIRHGCDGNTLEVTPWAGAGAVAPGLVWLAPQPWPAGWAPAAVEIEAEPATQAAHRYRAGRLGVEVTALGPREGELRLRFDDVERMVAPLSQDAMDGAELPPLDLRPPRDVGEPAPIAAWSLAPAGPVVVVMYTEGFEGFVLDSYLVDERGATRLEQLGGGLYYCAF